ncbi:MAG: 30S ribosomal protein S9 [Candidatus Taylorbacteria bacterium RIFCSPLOWO2_01_FULL_44_26]|uniref:Small ribosomal subunit protein uS9 n=2 Tax=Candidatus Tayloriibacteriota TaxID=1817919 RepID=A0A1G2MJC7_9BACT|nr:MAG: 30S ribosomal protein S9 [Candidatus Taylorbacteria bacterium RIFCSPHIGHO2_02_FULL_44_12]OHA31408.1 MAG: 30S ribosomal protein S9 [Candidatus Taylorbacteria bacterium RIFCSPLOWO2_01_FULL_44_26]
MKTKTPEKYFEAVGRRKTATARVRLFPGTKVGYEINGKELEKYFQTREMRLTATEAINGSKTGTKFFITAKISGGGLAGQAEALRLGIARALIISDLELRGRLKKLGFLKRDPRAKERRKFGLKKARKAPQWSKR